MIEGFDPEESFIDRRIFYEVTGKRLIAGEFLKEDTSGKVEDDLGVDSEDDPLDIVFNDQVYRDERSVNEGLL